MATPIGKKKDYKYFACYKKGDNGGLICEGRDTCVEAYEDLKKLEKYIGNDLMFFGIVKTKGNNPLGHICHVN